MSGSMGDFQLHNGDCLDVMATMPESSIDTIITDPPYGLSFMGKDWDHGVPGVPFWAEALRVAKHGAMLLAFGGTRTVHRLTVAIEDAGWEIRDVVMWIYGSGFPKSHDISKAIDKAAGVEREVVGVRRAGITPNGNLCNHGVSEADKMRPVTAPATPAAELWDGYGTSLKPAYEPVIVAMKPLDGTFAQNALQHGVAGLWIDGGRVEAEQELAKNWDRNQSQSAKEGRNAMNGGLDTIDLRSYAPSGRWPANVILSYPEDEYEMRDDITPEQKAAVFEWMMENG